LRPENTFGCSPDAFVLPNAQNFPTEFSQDFVGFGVTRFVRVNFLNPPNTICFRRSSMPRASVPEAAVDEYSDFLGNKRDVY
jgi:hypothetical protein